MKKHVRLIATLSVFATLALLAGCDLFPSAETPPVPEIPDYNEDIIEVAPEDVTIENFTPEEDTPYYTSPGFSLWMEVNGMFLEVDYFSLDGSKRVYDNLYFYEGDYFYIVTDDYKDLYASLGDASDTQYAEEEKDQGYDIQINVKKSGIYKLTFDVETLKFDMEYKAEIATPVYYTMKSCQIYSATTKWVDMTVNPANEEEFYIENFQIDVSEPVSFFDRTHVSLYKVTLHESCNKNLATYAYPSVTVSVSGNYNVYVNAKTYAVRLELLNPETAKYSCVYYDGSEFITLSPYDESVPYLFRQEITVDTQFTTSVPDFYTEAYKTYELTVIKNDLVMGSGTNYYFKQPGNYVLIINLKTYEIEVELLPE